MKAKLYYIQAAEGTDVKWETWTAQEPYKNERITLDALKTCEVELPQGWSIGRTADGTRSIFDTNDMAVIIKGDYNDKIYALCGETKKKVHLKKARD